jgi:hypothetical protein
MHFTSGVAIEKRVKSISFYTARFPSAFHQHLIFEDEMLDEQQWNSGKPRTAKSTLPLSPDCVKRNERHSAKLK